MTAQATPQHTPRRRATVYETYLRTDELLALQKPPAERLHADEVTFQIVHQTFELWWKLTVEQFQAAIEQLEAGRADLAARTIRRAVSAQSVVLQALRQLEFVAPADFLVIRTGLGNGSGSESPGFRAILRTALPLWEAFAAALERAGTTPVDLYADPRVHTNLYDCAEALTDFDEQFHLFRAAHLKLAQRNLGLRAIGTGGTPMPQLERTLHDLLFAPLWEARDALLQRAQEAQQAQQTQSKDSLVSGHGHP